ncbi:uncharacterized protein LOC143901881 [Temnothorax americanus]|uniref:uncharacterized protein LOC143901881 n=1 Tax=Temnothorax americanus TaxID=1964332 RepID=UPI0040676380
MLDAQNEEALRETKLHIKFSNEGMLVYGEWSNEKLLSLLKDKLVRHNNVKSLSACTDVSCDALCDKSLHFIIHNGMYNKCILVELEGKGMSLRSIMKAMKYGLLGLTSEELKYFYGFGAEIDVDTWTKKLDGRLIWNLAATGLTENQCWTIVMCGLVSQDESILYRLLSSGIDVPGILNWQGKAKPASPTIIRFLKKLGLDEDTCNYVGENGIDDEVENILIDLGYNEYRKKEALGITEEILHECSLTVLESHSTFLEGKTSDTVSDNSLKTSCSCSSSKTAFSDISIVTNLATCICYLNSLPKEQAGEILTRNDYLRQNVMVPLSWAISRALRYQPTDPNHYIAHQLLRWKYGNVSQKEMHSARQFIASVATTLDQTLMQKREVKNAVNKCLNKAVVRDVACNLYSERQKLYRIKECYWKCIKVPISALNTSKLNPQKEATLH